MANHARENVAVASIVHIVPCSQDLEGRSNSLFPGDVSRPNGIGLLASREILFDILFILILVGGIGRNNVLLLPSIACVFHIPLLRLDAS